MKVLPSFPIGGRQREEEKNARSSRADRQMGQEEAQPFRHRERFKFYGAGVGETRTVLILMRYNMAKLDQRRRVGKNDFKP